MKDFEVPQELTGKKVHLKLLTASDFESLFSVASDPLIWEQHPIKDRYKREVFETFFQGALESKSAYLIYNKDTNQVIGSSRYYDFDAIKSQINIGYTFYNRESWGKGFNEDAKHCMLEYAFQFVDKVHFHIGANNIRSQKAIQKLGTIKIEEKPIEYFGEKSTLNYVFEIRKEDY